MQNISILNVANIQRIVISDSTIQITYVSGLLERYYNFPKDQIDAFRSNVVNGNVKFITIDSNWEVSRLV